MFPSSIRRWIGAASFVIPPRIKVAEDRTGRRASRVARTFNDELDCYWKGLAEGPARETANRYDEARRSARSLGFDYIPANELLFLTQEKRLERLEALVTNNLTNSAPAREALLGTAPQPAFRLSELFEAYETAIRDEIRDLSPDQKRIWRNGRIRSVAQFVQVVGDKAVCELTHNDAIGYAEWWRERVVEGAVAAKSANNPPTMISASSVAC